VAGALALAALLAGCSSPAHPRVAGLGTGATASGAGGAASSGDQAFIDYAKCMRAHGVTDFPDPAPRPGHSGLSLQFPEDNGTPVYRAADDQCKQLIASVLAMKENAAKNRMTPQALQALAGYARCMRAHQIPMLDPDPVDGHLSLGTVAGLPNHVGRTSPQFGPADAACRSLLPPGTPDDGSGPP
jgi:hypothetical protein